MKCKYEESCGYEICTMEECCDYEKGTMTNGDRIRAMTDEELAHCMIGIPDMDSQVGFCQNLPKCEELLDTEDGIPSSMCKKCLLKWLQQPAEDL